MTLGTCGVSAPICVVERPSRPCCFACLSRESLAKTARYSSYRLTAVANRPRFPSHSASVNSAPGSGFSL